MFVKNPTQNATGVFAPHNLELGIKMLEVPVDVSTMLENILGGILLFAALMIWLIVKYGGLLLAFTLAFLSFANKRTPGDAAARSIGCFAIWVASNTLPWLVFHGTAATIGWPEGKPVIVAMFVAATSSVQLWLVVQMRRVLPAEFRALSRALGWHAPHRRTIQTSTRQHDTGE